MRSLVKSDLLRAALTAVSTPRTCASGAAFRSAELEGAQRLAPIERAIWAGINADRPAWIFLGAYQAAQRACFPLLDAYPGWLAFVVSDGEPPMHLQASEDQTLLSGEKSWVAAADCVDWLVCSARSNAGVEWVVLERAVVANRLTLRDAPGFLPDLAQGRLRLTDHPVTDAQKVALDARSFGAVEAQMVTAACAAALLAEQKRAGIALDEPLLDALADVVAQVTTGERPVAALLELDQAMRRALHALLERGAAIGPAAHWPADQRLFGMYGDGIAKRAARAKQVNSPAQE